MADRIQFDIGGGKEGEPYFGVSSPQTPITNKMVVLSGTFLLLKMSFPHGTLL